ncbi:unnamed protein product [Arabidopsis lyrata]|uniref:Predicted protein n=1 Tax=Arabidopsis lyrata subsp. lyrata TaxID=81972 RepID=D7LXI0_ARALL|nr:predicted protein [Arabidopsis lyrata subsp. lyrata]CAH8270012.1 unnamed protein product [Arabidopsis lyrata]
MEVNNVPSSAPESPRLSPQANRRQKSEDFRDSQLSLASKIATDVVVGIRRNRLLISQTLDSFYRRRWGKIRLLRRQTKLINLQK